MATTTAVWGNPNRRSGHTFTVIGTNGFLFGGIDHASPPGPSNDIYRLKLKNDAFAWSKINDRARTSASMATHSKRFR